MSAERIEEPGMGERPSGSHFRANGRPKVCYPDRKAAERGARRNRGHGAKGEFHAYPCAGYCSGWHLASGPRRRDEA